MLGCNVGFVHSRPFAEYSLSFLGASCPLSRQSGAPPCGGPPVGGPPFLAVSHEDLHYYLHWRAGWIAAGPVLWRRLESEQERGWLTRGESTSQRQLQALWAICSYSSCGSAWDVQSSEAVGLNKDTKASRGWAGDGTKPSGCLYSIPGPHQASASLLVPVQQ